MRMDQRCANHAYLPYLQGSPTSLQLHKEGRLQSYRRTFLGKQTGLKYRYPMQRNRHHSPDHLDLKAFR